MNFDYKDLLFFKKMITPYVIQIIFWIGVVMVVVSSIGGIFQGSVLRGLVTLILGPLFVRVFCEMMILLFSVNDRLAEIKDLLSGKKEKRVK
jgi:hypothetical protein